MWRRPSNFSSSATTTTKIEDLLVRKPTGKSVRMNGFSVALPLFFPPSDFSNISVFYSRVVVVPLSSYVIKLNRAKRTRAVTVARKSFQTFLYKFSGLYSYFFFVRFVFSLFLVFRPTPTPSVDSPGVDVSHNNSITTFRPPVSGRSNWVTWPWLFFSPEKENAIDKIFVSCVWFRRKIRDGPVPT